MRVAHSSFPSSIRGVTTSLKDQWSDYRPFESDNEWTIKTGVEKMADHKQSKNSKSKSKTAEPKARGTANEVEILAQIVKENPGLEKRILSIGEQALERLELRRRGREKTLNSLG